MKQPTLQALFVAFVAVLPACKTEQEAPRQNLASAAPNVVELSTADYRFQAPNTITAGWTTFRFANNGDDVHYAHIVRLDSGRTVSELVDAYAVAIRTSGPRPAWVRRFGGPGGAAPGDSSNVTQYLEPGRYVWICPVEDSGGTPHFSKGEFTTFVVRAASPDAAGQTAAPAASAGIRLMDFTFTLEAPLKAGQHTIRVENAGKQPHDLVMLKLAQGKTLEEVRLFLNPERARRPDEASQPQPSLESLGTGVGGIAAIGPGMKVFFAADLTQGEYVLACMATAPDGRSHIEHGMIQQIRVQ
ncbi:MAG: hypothetical protein H0U64_10605 [Gemmatimonadaceae bacterium]|nr:hypothetical protein [Gemmatimonadaceae bacterium]